MQELTPELTPELLLRILCKHEKLCYTPETLNRFYEIRPLARRFEEEHGTILEKFDLTEAHSEGRTSVVETILYFRDNTGGKTVEELRKALSA